MPRSAVEHTFIQPLRSEEKTAVKKLCGPSSVLDFEYAVMNKVSIEPLLLSSGNE